MISRMNQTSTKAKPMTDKMSCPMPSSQRRATSEPNPGVPSRLRSVALRALVRLIFFAVEDGFISEHQRRKANRSREHNADAAGQPSCETDQGHQDRQAKDQPPMPADLLPTGFYRRANIH